MRGQIKNLCLPQRLNWLPAGAFALAAVCLWGGFFFPGRSITPRRELILLTDVSASLRPAEAVQAELAAQVKALLQPDQCITLYTAAGYSVAPAEYPPVWATDYASALIAARAYPRSGPTCRRVVILGDGRTNRGGDAAAVIGPDIRVDAVAVCARPAEDARIVQFSAPAVAPTGVPFTCQVEAAGDVARPASLIVRLAGGAVLARKTVSLDPVGRWFDFSVTLGAPGLQRLTAELGETDSVPENNRAEAAVLLRGGGMIWCGQAPPPELIPAAPAVVSVEALTPAVLRGAASVVLCAIRPESLPPAASLALREAVLAGTGLLVYGGPAGWGLDAPPPGAEVLAELLPAGLNPRLARSLVIALDVSGSMAAEAPEATGGRLPAGSRLARAQAAVRTVCAQLSEGDRLALVAFAGEAVLALDWVTVDRAGRWRERVDPVLAGLSARAGTSVPAGLKLALQVLGGEPGREKGAVVLTDGGSAETGEELAGSLRELAPLRTRAGGDLTVLLLAEAGELAAGLERELAAQVVRVTGAQLPLPELLRRAVQGRTDYLHSGQPEKLDLKASPIAWPRGMPSAVAGYVAAGPLKPGATAALTTTENTLLVALGRPGLGRVAQVAGRPWGEWGWPDSPATRALAGWLLEWCRGGAGGARLTARRRDGRLQVEVSGLPGRSEGVLLARLRTVDQPLTELALRCPAVAAGRWVGEIPEPAAGLYRLSAESGSRPLAEGAVAVENRAEWQSFGVDGRELARIARAGGGELVAGPEQLAGWDQVPVVASSASASPAVAGPIGALICLLVGLLLRALRRV